MRAFLTWLGEFASDVLVGPIRFALLVAVGVYVYRESGLSPEDFLELVRSLQRFL